MQIYNVSLSLTFSGNCLFRLRFGSHSHKDVPAGHLLFFAVASAPAHCSVQGPAMKTQIIQAIMKIQRRKYVVLTATCSDVRNSCTLRDFHSTGFCIKQ